MSKMNLNKDCAGCNDDVVEYIRWEDGRHAEKHVKESFDPCTGEGEKVVEYYVEEERPKPLHKVVREKLGVHVKERTVEDVDTAGNVVARVVESTDPAASRLQIIERSAVAPAVAQSDDSDGCYVTREEMVDMFVNAVSKVKNGSNYAASVPAPMPAAAPRNLQEETKFKLEGEEGSQWGGQVVTMGLLALITAEAALLAWVLFFM